MPRLPLVIEKLILQYAYEMEKTEKYDKVMRELLVYHMFHIRRRRMISYFLWI